MAGRRWTPDEVEQLLLAPRDGIVAVAERLGRSESSVRRALQARGLPRRRVVDPEAARQRRVEAQRARREVERLLAPALPVCPACGYRTIAGKDADWCRPCARSMGAFGLHSTASTRCTMTG